jgi:cellulose synthase/poly-beta-1,6-N-acetylglucosamine synthase-like glycosyltransferase
MLNEQNIAESTYQHFFNIIENRPACHVVFVTTEKEKPPIGIPYTRTILEQAANRQPHPRIHLFHYPLTRGVMAHQLNYAIKQIRQHHPDDNFWIGVYNADSRITNDVLDYVLPRFSMEPYRECAFQQYSWYPAPQDSKAGSILYSAALWQTRWSLTFEIPRVLFQLRLDELFRWVYKSFPVQIARPIVGITEILIEKMNYVIGHGLFIHAKTIHQVGGFPEDTINEDAFLGYLLNNERIPIYPIPFLEQAEFAPSIAIYIRQQTSWFNGPWYAFQYLWYYLKGPNPKHPYRPACKKNTASILRAVALAMKLFCHAIYWLFSPILLLILLPISLFYTAGWGGLVIWVAVVVAHLPLTHWLTRIVAAAHVQQTHQLPKPSLFFCVGFFAIHCIGPFRNLILQVKRQNTIDRKYKTERAH